MNALKRQSGAVAIEFALLFLVLFAVLYGTIAFSVPLAIQASLKHLAAEAARSAIRVEPSGSDEEVGNHLQNYLQSYLSTEGRSWVPRQWYTGCEGDAFVTLRASQADICISYRGPQGSRNYNEDPIIPILNLPGIGPLPRLPNSLQGRSSVTLH